MTNLYIVIPQAPMEGATYSGHERRHALRMKAIKLHDGITFNVKGPMKARERDKKLDRLSGIDEKLPNGLVIIQR